MSISPNIEDIPNRDIAEDAIRGLFLTRDNRNDPWPLYRRIREAQPVHFSDTLNAWVLSRQPDIKKVLTSPHAEIRNTELRFQPDWRDHASQRNMSEYLVLRDGPDHRQIRNALSRQWLRGYIERFRPMIREIVEELTSEFVSQGGGDFLRDVAYRVPVSVICRILGVSRDDTLDWQALSAELNLISEQDYTAEELRRADVAATTIRDYWRNQCEARRADPKDDLLSALVSGDALDFDTAVAIAESLFIGGFETTTLTLASGLWTLLQNPVELERVRNDSVARSVLADEILRYCPPIMMTLRVAARPITLTDGTVIGADQKVIMLLASSNRDADLFEDGETFCVKPRPVGGAHFGYGIHACLGMWLAKLEIEETLGTLIDRTTDIRFDGPAPPFRDRLGLRGPEELMVKVRPLCPSFPDRTKDVP